MATKSFEDLRIELRDATDGVAARQQEFLDQISKGGISQEAEDTAIAGMQAEIDRLKTFGVSATNPLPPVVEPA